jgi:isopropylmalate/homocitrate/citramalate synthase
MNTENIDNYLYTWNSSPPEHLKHVRIDDDIRDGMQSAFIRRPSLEERKALLDLMAKVGTYSVVLGFPAISEKEFEECRELVKHIEQNNLDLMPFFLARTLQSDLEPIVALSEETSLDLRAETFLGISPLRRRVESWDFETLLKRVAAAGKYLSDNNTGFGLSFEDSTRTPPEDLGRVVDTAVDAGVKDVAICDTVGECTPDGAARITEFVIERIRKAGGTVEVAWHGHNDKGLGVANAIAAATVGANVISGTFLGIGERSGNTALEQVVTILALAGNEHHNLKYVQPYCEKLSEYTDIPIGSTAPIVGKQAFATGAGTHSAAILKARKLGTDFEDYVFSGVPASKLGRIQDVVVSPTSGMANARYMLEQIGINASDEIAQNLLTYAKSKDRWLSSEEIYQYINQSG